MTYQELMATIKSLPPIKQFDLANEILDTLAESGSWPLSSQMKNILDQRAKKADENTESLVPAEQVFADLRAKLQAN